MSTTLSEHERLVTPAVAAEKAFYQGNDTKMRPPEKSKLSSHLRGVDGLRGLAAIMIVVYHLYTNMHLPEWRPWHHVNLFRPLTDGWCGVNLFLVLSGFCLFWPYVRNPDRKFHFKDFMQRRIRRIMPAYYASLVIVPLAYLAIVQALQVKDQAIPLPHGVLDVVLHLLLLHSLTAATIWSWYGVTWSLGLEWTWYLTFPLAVWVFRRFGGVKALLTFAGITIVYRFSLFAIVGPSSHYPDSQLDYTFSLRVFVAARIFEFAVGMFVAWWLASKPISVALTRFSAVVLVATLIAARLSEHTDNFLPFRDVFFGIAFGSMLLLAVSPTANLVRSACASKMLSGIGEYSYSLYLFHLPIVLLTCVILLRAGYSGPLGFALSLLSLPVSLYVAKLAFLAFERPFLKTSPGVNPGGQNVAALITSPLHAPQTAQ